MKLNEAEMRIMYQIENTSQNAALNEIYMTWRLRQARSRKTRWKASCDPFGQECMDVIRERVRNHNG